MLNFFQQKTRNSQSLHICRSTHRSFTRFQYTAAWLLAAYIDQPLPATAEVVADQSASANSRTVIDSTANNLPLVQIATPSHAGVSHNQFIKFNVDPAGIILNNSQTTVLTLQAGYVPANPNLANGTSRVILNEITSNNVSQLNGYTEVAGTRAEVIIANPNGIICNGCGFINTSRGVLTTGTPVMHFDGSLDAFRVTGGQIQIGSAGMNGGNLDQLDLITRSLKVNGELWVNDLRVITGTNLVDYDTLSVQLIKGDADKPEIGIDVALLGGMYANKIHLIGNETGVGVNISGILSAQAGGFSLDNQGRITLSGNTTSSGNLTVSSSTSITNSGTLYSRQAAQIISTGNIDNSGLISAQGNLTFHAVNFDSTGTLGAGIDTSGAANQNGSIFIATQDHTIANGLNIAGGSISISASNIDLANSNTYSKSGFNLDASEVNRWSGSAGNIDLSNSWMESAGNIALNASGTVNNTSGNLFGAQITGNTTTLDNTNGQIGNTLGGTGNITLTIDGNFTNESGLIASSQDLVVNASTIIGNGLTISGRDATINLQGNYINDAGNVIRANRNLVFSSSGNFINQTSLEAAGKLTLDSASIENQTDAVINSSWTFLNSVGDITNAGRIEGSLVETHSSNFSNSATVMGDVLNIYTNNLYNLNAAAFIGSTQNVNLTIANELNNRDGATIYSVGDINIGSSLAQDNNGYLTGNMSRITNQSATIEAMGNIRISANNITNKRSVVGVEWGPSWTGTYVSGNPRYTPTFADQRFTAVTTTASQMLAGGGIWINGATLTNDYSNITAGGALTAQLTNLINTGAPFQRRETRVGQQDVQVWQQVGTWCPSGVSIFGGCIGGTAAVMGWVNVTVAYAPAPIYTNIPGLVNISYLQNTQPSIELRTVNIQSIAAEVAPAITNSGTPSPLTVPTGGIYSTQPGQRYLVVTDPRFSSYQNFISSDYMLNRLVMDPQQIQKRLGDGFYEQKLVTEQITAQTGRRYLGGYTDGQSQFIALLDAGVSAATGLQLVPGISLTEKQIDALTQDIVWMVERDVALPDGTLERVLAPHVYLTRLHQNNLKLDGTLLAANDIHISASESITNSGLIEGRDSNILHANNITNKDGVIGSQGQTELAADNDIINISGIINGQNVGLAAGRDIISQRTSFDVSRTVSLGGQPGTDTGLELGLFRHSPSPLISIVNSTGLGLESVISSTNNLNLTTGRNLILSAANINAGGDASFSAGRDLTAGVLTNTETSTASRYNVSSRTVAQFGSSVQTGGNLNMDAGNNIGLTSTVVNSGNNATLIAGGNLTMDAAKNSNALSFDTGVVQQNSFDENVLSTKLNAGNNITIATTIGSGKANKTEEGNVALQSAIITNQTGSLSVFAGNNVDINAVMENHQSYRQERVQSSGIFSSTNITTRDVNNHIDSIGSSLDGNRIIIQSRRDINISGSNLVASGDIALGANNDITLNAAQNIAYSSNYRDVQTSGIFSNGGSSIAFGSKQQTDTSTMQNTAYSASTVGSIIGNISMVAGQHYNQTGSDVITPQGNIDIYAQNVLINEAQNSDSSVTTSEYKQSGVTVSFSSPVISAAQTASQMDRAANQTASGRMKILAAANTAISINSATDAVSAGMENGGNIANQAGGIVASVSIGNSSSESTTIQTWSQSKKSNLKAGGNININAIQHTSLTPKETTIGPDSLPSVKSTGIPIRNGEYEEGTQIGNLTIQGGQIGAGNSINLDADNNINLLAAQNSSSQSSKSNFSSNSIGAGASTNSGMTVNVAASRGRGRADGNDVSYINTQIDAGSILTLNSGRDLTLRGATASGNRVIAVVGGNLNIVSLQDSSIYNSEQKSTDFSIAIPIAGPGGGSFNDNKNNINSNYASVTAQSGLLAGDSGYEVKVNGNTILLGGVITASDRAIFDDKLAFVTQGTISLRDILNHADFDAKAVGISAGVGSQLGASGGTGNDSKHLQSVTKSGIGISTPTDTGEIVRIFDAQKILNEINSQVQITQSFSQQAPRFVGDYATSKLNEAAAMHQLANQETDPAKQFELTMRANALESNWSESGAARVALHAAVGALSGDLAGAAGAGTSALTVPIIAAQINTLDAPPEVKQALVLSVGSAVGSLSGGSTGATAGLSQTGNNYLTHQENDDLRKAASECSKGNPEACNTRDVLDALDKQRDEKLKLACQANVNSEECQGATADMRNDLATYFKIRNGDQLSDSVQSAGSDNAELEGFSEKAELQSYVDLLKVSNQQMQPVQSDGNPAKLPDTYNSDPYQVIDPQNPDLYVVVKVGDQWGVVGSSDKVFTSVAAINGILNNSDYAPGLMGSHVEFGFNTSSLYTLYYNPTEGFISDSWETLKDKLGNTTSVAKQFAQVLSDVQTSRQPVSWIAHSQGGEIFSEAVRFNGSDLSKNSVVFHAGANNQLITNYYLHKAGINSKSKTIYQNSPVDLVPNIIGFNTMNPIKIIGSDLAAPLLFMGPSVSPHTLPYKSSQTITPSQGVAR